MLVIYVGCGVAQGWGDHVRWETCWLAPLVGFLGGTLFAGLGFHVAAITRNMANFSFFISGALMPMSLF